MSDSGGQFFYLLADSASGGLNKLDTSSPIISATLLIKNGVPLSGIPG